jgi:hypothetical protein
MIDVPFLIYLGFCAVVGFLLGRMSRNRRIPAPYTALAMTSNEGARGNTHGWTFRPETKSLDPTKAPLREITYAMEDCWRCLAAEYPETKEGCGYAEARLTELNKALRKRFPKRKT